MLSQDRKTDPFIDIISGAFSGVVSRLVIAPLDLIKIRLQLQHENYNGHLRFLHRPKYTGVFQTTRLVVAEEGFRALWKGSLAGICLYGPYMAVQFVVYNQMKSLFAQSTHPLVPNKSWHPFTCGAIAASAATIASYPFDILRTRIAAQGKHNENYANMKDAIKKTWSREGLRGFYKGIGITLLGVAPNMGLQFSMYEYLDSKATKLIHTFVPWTSIPFATGISKFIIGFAAGSVAKILTMPLDVMKRRLQMAGVPRDPIFGRWHSYSGGMLECAVTIYKGEGWRGFFKGTVPSLLKAAPTSAVAFVSYEFCAWVFTKAKEWRIIG